MRFALLAAASTLLVGFASLACSGTASTDDGSPEPAAEENVTGSGTATTTPTTGTATTTPVVDAGAVVIDAATIPGDAGTACLADSLHETEANDTTANVVPATTGSFCGRLNANDVDIFSFTMPAQVGPWSVNFDKLVAIDGNVQFGIEADVNGQQFDVRQGRWPFVAGGVYTFKLSAASFSTTTAALDYKVSLTFGQ